MSSNSNRGVVYLNPAASKFGRSIFRAFAIRPERRSTTASFLKVVTTNICGSDQHMVRGRTTAPGRHGARPRNYRPK